MHAGHEISECFDGSTRFPKKLSVSARLPLGYKSMSFHAFTGEESLKVASNSKH